MREAAVDTAASALVGAVVELARQLVDHRGLALLGFLLGGLLAGRRIGLHDALAEHRQRVGHLADLVAAAFGVDLGGEIAAASRVMVLSRPTSRATRLRPI